MAKAREVKDRVVDQAGNQLTGLATPTVVSDAVPLGFVTPGTGLVYANGVAAALTIATVGTHYQKPLLFAGSTIETGTPADTIVPSTSVANLAALAALVVGTTGATIRNGAAVHVQTLDRVFRLDTVSALTADGINIVTATTGRWIAHLALSQKWYAVTDWWIDPTGGNDENTGATGSRIKTWGELCRRIIGAVFKVTVVVNIVGDLPTTDPLITPFDTAYNQSTQQFFVVRGVKTSVFSGAITGYAARNPAGNTGTQMTISSLPVSWTASSLVGKRIEWTNGSAYKTAWVCADLGSKTARISCPYTPNFNLNSTQLGVSTDFVNGDTINVYQVPSIGRAGSITCKEILFVDLNMPTMRFDQCLAFASGCQFTSTLTSASTVQFASCRISNASFGGSRITLASGCVLDSISTHANSGWITATGHLTVYRIKADSPASTVSILIQGDLEHFYPSGLSNNAGEYLFSFVSCAGGSLACQGEVYGDPVYSLVQFLSQNGNMGAHFAKQPKTGTNLFWNTQSTGTARQSAVADLSFSSFCDERGNEAIGPAGRTVSGVLRRSYPNLSAPTIADYQIFRLDSAGAVVLAQADSAANATGELGAVIGRPQTSNGSSPTTDTYTLAVDGCVPVQFDGAPTVNAAAYLSPSTAGYATTTVPAASGTNQFRYLGVVVAVSGTLGLIDWDPTPAPKAAHNTATTWTSFTIGADGTLIPVGTGSGVATAYSTLLEGATALTQRSAASFAAADFDLVDNSGAGRTDIALANIGALSLGGAGRVITTAASDSRGRLISLADSALYYQTIQDSAGAAVTQAPVLKASSSFGVSTASGVTTLALATVVSGATVGGGSNRVKSVTFNSFGQITAATASTDSYAFIQSNGGLSYPQESVLNFTPSFTVTDVSGSARTDIALADVVTAGTAGASLSTVTVTYNSKGQITGTTTTALPALPSAAASYWTATSEASLTGPNKQNLGALTTGLVKITVTAGVAVPATANPGSDYLLPIGVANDRVLYMAAGTVAGSAAFTYNGSAFALQSSSVQYTQPVVSGSTPVGWRWTGAAHTSLPSAVEATSALFDFSATKTWAAGNIPTQREARFVAPTYAFPSGSTITTAATLAISGAPIAGANATLTNALALWVESGASLFGGTVRVSGLTAGGLVKATATTGALGLALGGSDFEFPLTFNNGITRSVNTVGLTTIGSAATVGAGGTRVKSITYNVYGQITATTAQVDAYQFIQNATGLDLPQERTLNFTTSFSLTDVPGSARTDVALTTVGPGVGTIGGGGLGIASISLNAFGQVTAAATYTIPSVTQGYTTIKNGAGTSLTQRLNLRFSAAFNPTDSTPDTLVDLAVVTAGGTVGGTGTRPKTITYNNFGQITAATQAYDAYQFIQNATGIDFPQERTLNFTTSFALTDVSGSLRTDVALASTISAGSAGGSLSTVSLTYNAFGQLTGATTTALPALPSAAASYWTSTSEASLTGASKRNLGALTTGLLLNTVTAGVATPSRAIPGVDYQGPISVANDQVLYMAGGVPWGSPSYTYNGTAFALSSSSVTFSQPVVAGSTPVGWRFNGGAHTSLPAAEATDVHINLARTVQFVSGIGAQRAMRISPPTYSMTSPASFTNAATLAIGGAPVAGVNAGIGNALALWVEAGASQFDGTVKVTGLAAGGLVKASATTGALGLAIPNSDYEVFLAFSSGLTRVVNTVTNDVITGIGGSPTWTGSTSSGGSLTIRASSNATQGSLTLTGGGTGSGVGISLAHGSNLNATSGTQIGMNYSATFAPASGSAGYLASVLQYTVSQNAAATGWIEGLSIRPIVSTIGTTARHSLIAASTAGTLGVGEVWRLDASGKTWMRPVLTNTVGDTGMSSNGRPRFCLTSVGDVPVMAHNESFAIFGASGAFDAGQTWLATFEEHSFADGGCGETANKSQTIQLTSGADNWTGHPTDYRGVRRPVFTNPLGRTMRLRMFAVTLIEWFGTSGHTMGDMTFSVYWCRRGNGVNPTMLIAEVARVTFPGGTLNGTAQVGTRYAEGVSGINIITDQPFDQFDQFMITARNTTAFSSNAGGFLNGCCFTAHARFDVRDS